MSEFKVRELILPDVFLIEFPRFFDERGSFSKFFHDEALAKLGIGFVPAETFFTRSASGVLRGMHFQVGPAEHVKLVCCTQGSVLDVVVDIRLESCYFNQPVGIELNEKKPLALLIGKGYAHGFLSLDDNSTLLYATSTVHQPEFDCGVLWSSINFNWPIQNPLISERDQKHPAISNRK